MEFTDKGLEIPVQDSMDLLQIFGFVVKDAATFYGPDHPETREAIDLLSPLVEVAASRESDRLIVPHEHLGRMAKLAEMALKVQGIEQDFCTSGWEHEFRPELRAKAYRALAMAAEISDQVRVDQTFNDLTRSLE